MSYAKFRTKETNKVFYYRNIDNALYNDRGEILSLPPKEGWEYFEDIKKQNIFGVTHKTNKPTALRILLGHACNYSCGYCMQKDIGNPDERPENFWLEPFIESVKTHLDLEQLERVELWGGEPFLYWNDMVPIMKHLDAPNRHFYISTNGSPLRQKHVDFFKTLQATVMMGISHDGPGQELLRGEDIFHKESVANSIRQLGEMHPKVQFSFNTVVSAQNFDLFKINDYFKDVSDRLGLKHARLSFIPARVYDDSDSQNSADHVIKGDLLPEFKKMTDSYLKAAIKQAKEGGDRFLNSNIVDNEVGVLRYALLTRHQIPVTMTSSCGADAADILSMDIRGNVRLCPHTSEKFTGGHINNLKGVKIIGLTLERKDSHCGTCPVKRLCKSSCPIDFPTEVFLHNCRVEKIWYSAIQQNAFALLFGEEVELLETGIDENRLKENTALSIPA
jgi:uncharacterized protein